MGFGNGLRTRVSDQNPSKATSATSTRASSNEEEKRSLDHVYSMPELVMPQPQVPPLWPPGVWYQQCPGLRAMKEAREMSNMSAMDVAPPPEAVPTTMLTTGKVDMCLAFAHQVALATHVGDRTTGPKHVPQEIEHEAYSRMRMPFKTQEPYPPIPLPSKPPGIWFLPNGQSSVNAPMSPWSTGVKFNISDTLQGTLIGQAPLRPMQECFSLAALQGDMNSPLPTNISAPPPPGLTRASPQVDSEEVFGWRPLLSSLLPPPGMADEFDASARLKLEAIIEGVLSTGPNPMEKAQAYLQQPCMAPIGL